MWRIIWHYLVLCLLILFLNLQVVCSSFFNSSPTSEKLCSPEQSFALLDFKNAFSIESSASKHCDLYAYSYPKTRSWKEGSDCCSWDGVTCDRFTGFVIGLDLSSSWLLGTIQDNSSLFLFHHLLSLNLACNNFGESQISSKFGLVMTKLTYLNLSFSRFSGSVPTETFHLSKLVSLDISDSFFYAIELEQHSFNMLSQNLTELRHLFLDGSMFSVEPASLVNLSSSLISLSLHDTGLSGEFPNDIFHFPFLQRLRLSQNAHLSGNLPFFNWSSPLKLLDLYGTNFSGNLPDTIGNLKFLTELVLSYCNFEGSIPVSLGNLTGISILRLTRNGFIGQVPASLSNLHHLTHLYLAKNNFSGQFPDVLGNLSKISHLVLSYNNFGGPLPLSLFNLTHLSFLDFSWNQLEGHFPNHVNGLTNLIKLRWSENLLNGKIPSWLLTLPSLEHLDLSNNRLTGPIDKLQQFGSLKYAHLQGNKIHGSIPNSISKLVNLTILDLSSNKLSGIVDTNIFSNLKILESVNLSHNTLLSLRTYNNENSSLPMLKQFSFSSCKLIEFPIFLRAAKSLEYLDLSNNKISGQISQRDSELWHNVISINLSHNSLISFEQIPSMKLQFLDLHSNLLQGPLVLLPDNIGFFSVAHNKLTGEIPSSFCNLSFIEILDLSNNSLGGIIPPCLVSCRTLFALDLRMNNFEGNIPQTFPDVNLLETLNLNGNQLEGQLPPSLINCRWLKVLDLGNNRINDTFPHWLGTLPELQVLVLRSNRFHGIVDDSKIRFSFPNLRIFDISRNGFIGLLPARYFENFKAMMLGAGNLVEMAYMGNDYYRYSVTLTVKGVDIEMVRVLSIFTTMDLSYNQFEGQISDTIGKLTSLKLLNFSYNNLTGYIPSSLGNLTDLESLDLSTNKLSGEVPVQMTNMISLCVLNLSYNQLEGSIPEGNQFNTFENSSYIGNSGLCGLPLSKICNNNDAPEPTPSLFDNKHNNSSWFDWKIIMMGYASGLVIGLSIGYIFFSAREPQWFMRMVRKAQQKKLILHDS